MNLLLLSAAVTLTPQAQAEVQAVRTAVARYADFEVARGEGWTKFGGDSPLMGEHWSLPPNKGGIDYQHGMALDWRRPSNLMYTHVGGRRVLTGVAFNVRLAPGEPVPAGFHGSADHWHVHDFRAAVAAATRERPFLGWLARGWMNQNWGNRGRLAMVHVWTGPIANPDGPFAHHNRAIPYAKLGLPLNFATGASMAAARGLALATKDGCAENIDGGLWIANASGSVKTQLHAACRAANDHLRPALASGRAAEINRMAEHSWAMFERQWVRLLTPEQRSRIAAITEHGPAATAAPAASADHHGHEGHDH